MGLRRWFDAAAAVCCLPVWFLFVSVVMEFARTILFTLVVVVIAAAVAEILVVLIMLDWCCCVLRAVRGV